MATFLILEVNGREFTAEVVDTDKDFPVLGRIVEMRTEEGNKGYPEVGEVFSMTLDPPPV